MPTIEEKKIRKIRRSIQRTRKLLKNNKVKRLDEKTVEHTNCYAYSLGIMYHGEKGRDFEIGFTEHILDEMVNPKEIIENICTDLKNLRISFRMINLEEEKILGDKEYLIKAFYAKSTLRYPPGDFHFIRQDKISGKWFHKMGWHRQPEFVYSNSEEQVYFDDDGEPIAFLNTEFLYKPLAYFAITEE